MKLRRYCSYGAPILKNEMFERVNCYPDILRGATLEVCVRHHAFVFFLLPYLESASPSPSVDGWHASEDHGGYKTMHPHYCHAIDRATMKLPLSFHDSQAACPHHRFDHSHDDAVRSSAAERPEQMEKKSPGQRFASPESELPGSMSNHMPGLRKNNRFPHHHTETGSTRLPGRHHSNTFPVFLETKQSGRGIGLDSPPRISSSLRCLAVNKARPCPPPIESLFAVERIKRTRRNRPMGRSAGRGCPVLTSQPVSNNMSRELPLTK